VIEASAADLLGFLTASCAYNKTHRH